MPNEMVERVARKSFACWRDRMTQKELLLDRGQAFEDMSESEQEFAYLHARAVIAALREPTDAMLTAAASSFDEAPENIWRHMIDEILK